MRGERVSERDGQPDVNTSSSAVASHEARIAMTLLSKFFRETHTFFITGGVMSLGDLVAQKVVEKKSEVDLARNARFALLGLLWVVSRTCVRMRSGKARKRRDRRLDVHPLSSTFPVLMSVCLLVSLRLSHTPSIIQRTDVLLWMPSPASLCLRRRSLPFPVSSSCRLSCQSRCRCRI